MSVPSFDVGSSLTPRLTLSQGRACLRVGYVAGVLANHDAQLQLKLPTCYVCGQETASVCTRREQIKLHRRLKRLASSSVRPMGICHVFRQTETFVELWLSTSVTVALGGAA